MPVGNGIFHLESDTSREAAGSTLYQWQDDQWALIGYHSKRLPHAICNYGVCELELTGLVCNICNVVSFKPSTIKKSKSLVLI